MHAEGYAQLIREILTITYHDLNSEQRRGGRHFQHRQEALAFLETEWFEYLCMSIDLDPKYVKSRLTRSRPSYAPSRRNVN